jgi:hypothetical protein
MLKSRFTIINVNIYNTFEKPSEKVYIRFQLEAKIGSR